MRGKHAASSAKRRADSAESQLDRLMEEVTDLRRKVKQYKSAYEMLPTLQAQLRDIKREAGVPISDHLAMLSNHDEQLRDLRLELEEAWMVIIDELFEWLQVKPRSVNSFPPPKFSMALRLLPKRPMVAILQLMGISDRSDRRLLFEKGVAEHATNSSSKAITNTLYLNSVYGGRKSPSGFVDSDVAGI